MAGPKGVLRGDGPTKARKARVRFADDPFDIDQERQLESHSPSMGNPARSSTSPEERAKLFWKRRDRRKRLMMEHEASRPYNQFEAQVNQETTCRLFEANPNDILPTDEEVALFQSEAEEFVRRRWSEQGIWNEKWGPDADWCWKHEEPLESETESEIESEIESEAASASDFSFSTKQQRKPREPKTMDEKARIAERRILREQEREASRPYYQFVYQVSEERERIQGESPDWLSPDHVAINTTAYEQVKTIWTNLNIWNERWGVLPGMAWKHEEPFDKMAVDSPPLVEESPCVNSSHDLGEIPAKTMSGLSSVAESNSLRPVPSPVCQSPQRRQRSRPDKNNRLLEDEPTQPAANEPLDPVSPSKTPKVDRKKKQLPSVISSSADLELLRNGEFEGPLPEKAFNSPNQTRRSINEILDSELTQDSDGISQTAHSLRSPPCVRRGRKVASSSDSVSSAKPQGVSKNLRSSARERKGKKREPVDG